MIPESKRTNKPESKDTLTIKSFLKQTNVNRGGLVDNSKHAFFTHAVNAFHFIKSWFVIFIILACPAVTVARFFSQDLIANKFKKLIISFYFSKWSIRTKEAFPH